MDDAAGGAGGAVACFVDGVDESVEDIEVQRLDAGLD